MKKTISLGLLGFAAANLVYVGWSLYKNYKDYKNEEGIYTPEEKEVETPSTDINYEEAILEPEVQEEEPKKTVMVSKKAALTTVFVTASGLVLLGAAVGYRKGFDKCYQELLELKKEHLDIVNNYNGIINTKDNLLNVTKKSLINSEIDREKITLNALDMLLPDHMETRWLRVENNGYVTSNFTPKITGDKSIEDVKDSINDVWSKLYEPIVTITENGEPLNG